MRPHILVVEDEKHLGVGIKYNLEAENYRVTLVEDGPTALKLVDVSADSVDLIVLDLMLPGMSGYTVCETIRDAGITIPVLMLSARTLAEDRTRGFDVGANQYMSKPFELDELLSRIKNLLQASGNKTAPAATPRVRESVSEVEFGNVSVNFETHEAIVAEKAVRMTPKELKLLRYFVENPDRVISRNELLNEVWDISGNLQTRAVDQFIARLRKIIEPNTAAPVHLLTIRDAGYRFVLCPRDGVATGSDSVDHEHDAADEGVASESIPDDVGD
ncbi:MAG: response regulator transcription factor [Rubripirellula sp.]